MASWFGSLLVQLLVQLLNKVDGLHYINRLLSFHFWNFPLLSLLRYILALSFLQSRPIYAMLS